MNLLKGYLTYIMAAIAVIFGIWNVAAQTYMTTEQGVVLIWAGLTVFGIRRAV